MNASSVEKLLQTAIFVAVIVLICKIGGTPADAKETTSRESRTVAQGEPAPRKNDQIASYLAANPERPVKYHQTLGEEQTSGSVNPSVNSDSGWSVGGFLIGTVRTAASVAVLPVGGVVAVVSGGDTSLAKGAWQSAGKGLGQMVGEEN